MTEKPKRPEAGQIVDLYKEYLYNSSRSRRPSLRVSGKFFVYDGKIVRGRFLLTNKRKNANRKPAFLFATGWVNSKYV